MEGNTKRNIIIVIIITLIIVILSISSYYNRANEEWLVCTSTTKDKVYTETIKFKYDLQNKILLNFYRYEEYKPLSVDSYNEILNDLKDIEETAENDKYFKYIIEDGEGIINATTEINVLYYYELFDNYMEEKNIDSSMTLKQIKFVLDNDYDCKLSKKVGE